MQARNLPISRAFIFLILSLLFYSFPALAQATFSYPSPLCSNGVPVTPVTSAGFPAGGFYNSSPPGLSILPNNGMIDPSLSQPNTYTVTYTGVSCPTCVLSHVITIYETEQAGIINPTICSAPPPSSLVIVASPTAGVASYTWLPTGVTGPQLIIFPPYASQSYTLKITDVNGCGSQTTGAVGVIPSPSFSIQASSNGTICLGATAILTAVGAASPVQWSTGVTAGQIIVTPTVTTVYSASLSVSGCTATATKTVHITQVTLNVSPANPTVCAGKNITLTAVASPTATIAWYPGQLIQNSFVVAPSAPTSYTVKTISGCTVSSVINVKVSPSYTPITKFSYPFPICSNYPDQLPILDSGFTSGGNFSISPASTAFNDTTGLVNVANFVPGEYIVSYRTAASGCTVATNRGFVLDIGQLGQVDLVTDVIIYKGASATLSVSGGNYYQWSPGIYMDCSSCDAPVVSPPYSIQYCVSSDLCLDGGCVNVTVLCKNPGDLSVPNAFTPDGDGNNDKFCLQGWDECNKKFEILIFDRWGEKVYQSSDPNFCWDGVFNGKVLDAGVYTYAITASFEIVPRVDKKGTITIMR